MAVSTYALTSLANLKTSLGLSALETDKDAILEDSIDRATSIIESFVDRKLKSRTHYEWVQPAGDRSVTLDNPPIRTIDTVAFGRQDSLVVESDTAATDVLATVGFDGTEVRLRRVAADGTATTATLAADTYPTTASLVTQINSSVSGWTATLTESAYTRSLYRFGGRGVKDAPCHLEFPRDNVSEYEVEHAIGIIHITTDRFPGIRSDDAAANRFPGGFYPVFVQYEGGYETVPGDLEQACIEMAGDLYRDRLSDRLLQQEALGDYNYVRVTPDVLLARRASLLDAYREIR